ncbi:hypothetical protein ABH313_18395, partial [Chromobacterium vaccinii]|uniref:hypothetical protein n=1 Tax=Chromobacterium vaccinii TaxID=1108595 RepID=UPI003261765B
SPHIPTSIRTLQKITIRLFTQRILLVILCCIPDGYHKPSQILNNPQTRSRIRSDAATTIPMQHTA